MTKYGLKETIEDGDKGLLTPARLAKLEAIGLDLGKPYHFWGARKIGMVKIEASQ